MIQNDTDMNKENKRLTPLQKEIVSGLTAGSITSIVAHPLDLIKLRLQLLSTDKTNLSSIHNNNLQKYKHVIRNIVTPIKNDLMINNLYRGLTINVLGNSIAWALYFASYRSFKTIIGISKNGNDWDNSMTYLISGGLAGIFTSIITNPIWVLKTRIMSTNKHSFNKSYDSISSTYKSLITKEGYKSLLKGLTPSILGVSQGAIYFMIYDTLKQKKIQNNKNSRLSTKEIIIITSISKMISTSSVYPLQLLKSNLQSTNVIHSNNSMTTLNLATTIFKQNGIKGLYNGLATNLFKAVPTTCITFSIYEAMKGYL